MQQGYVKMSSYVLYFQIFMESRESCSATDGRAWKVDGRAQALVGPGLATPLHISAANLSFNYKMTASKGGFKESQRHMPLLKNIL